MLKHKYLVYNVTLAFALPLGSSYVTSLLLISKMHVLIIAIVQIIVLIAL